MPDETRKSQQHATMSSLKATHDAHRLANEVHSASNPELEKLKTDFASRKVKSDGSFFPRRFTSDFERDDRVVASVERFMRRLLIICGSFLAILALYALIKFKLQ